MKKKLTLIFICLNISILAETVLFSLERKTELCPALVKVNVSKIETVQGQHGPECKITGKILNILKDDDKALTEENVQPMRLAELAHG